jgi:hypothetical protein
MKVVPNHSFHIQKFSRVFHNLPSYFSQAKNGNQQLRKFAKRKSLWAYSSAVLSHSPSSPLAKPAIAVVAFFPLDGCAGGGGGSTCRCLVPSMGLNLSEPNRPPRLDTIRRTLPTSRSWSEHRGSLEQVAIFEHRPSST